MQSESQTWPLSPEGAPAEAVTLLTGISQMDADLKASLLNAFGVPVQIVRSTLNDRFTPVVFGNYLMLADILVPKGREEEALALIASEGEPEEGDGHDIPQ